MGKEFPYHRSQYMSTLPRSDQVENTKKQRCGAISKIDLPCRYMQTLTLIQPSKCQYLRDVIFFSLTARFKIWTVNFITQDFEALHYNGKSNVPGVSDKSRCIITVFLFRRHSPFSSYNKAWLKYNSWASLYARQSCQIDLMEGGNKNDQTIRIKIGCLWREMKHETRISGYFPLTIPTAYHKLYKPNQIKALISWRLCRTGRELDNELSSYMH